MVLVKDLVINKVKIEEFFAFNIEETIVSFGKELEARKITLAETEYDLNEDNFFAKSGVELIEECVIKNTENIGAQRFAVKINIKNVVDEVSK